MSGAAAPAPRAVAAMTAMELRLALRRGENLFATIVIPTIVLVLFSSICDLPDRDRAGRSTSSCRGRRTRDHRDEPRQPRDHDRLRPLVRGPETARRLAAEPRSSWSRQAPDRPGLEAVQVVLLVGVAVSRSAGRPGPGLAILAVVAVLLGTAAFAGLGLWLAGTLRAETTSSPSPTSCSSRSSSSAAIVVPLGQLPAPSRRSPRRSRRLRFGAAPVAFGAAPAGADVVSPLGLLAAWAVALLGGRVRGSAGSRPARARKEEPRAVGPGVLVVCGWLRGEDSNRRPSGYEPDELPLLHPACG